MRETHDVVESITCDTCGKSVYYGEIAFPYIRKDYLDVEHLCMDCLIQIVSDGLPKPPENQTLP